LEASIKIFVTGVARQFGHDAKIGDFSTIEAYCFLGGYAEIGDSSIMHVRSTLILSLRCSPKSVQD